MKEIGGDDNLICTGNCYGWTDEIYAEKNTSWLVDKELWP